MAVPMNFPEIHPCLCCKRLFNKFAFDDGSMTLRCGGWSYHLHAEYFNHYDWTTTPVVALQECVHNWPQICKECRTVNGVQEAIKSAKKYMDEVYDLIVHFACDLCKKKATASVDCACKAYERAAYVVKQVNESVSGAWDSGIRKWHYHHCRDGYIPVPAIPNIETLSYDTHAVEYPSGWNTFSGKGYFALIAPVPFHLFEDGIIVHSKIPSELPLLLKIDLDSFTTFFQKTPIPYDPDGMLWSDQKGPYLYDTKKTISFKLLEMPTPAPPQLVIET